MGFFMLKAKSNSTGEEQSFTIESSAKLSDLDIGYMIADAE
jgi:molecular chaperone DnaK (HSP70)